jgi:uncharacterized protein YfaS (alpha-2-macroglobulin family)
MAPFREIYGGGRGGGGGEGDPTAGQPRSDFQDTAAWFPSLVTNAEGVITVNVALPDNLTSWRLTARAVTKDTRVGEATANILTQQDIIVRPILPRGLVAGDEAVISALVHNYASDTHELNVTLEATLLGLNSPATQSVVVPAGEAGLVTWNVIAQETGTAQIKVSAVTGGPGAQDSVLLPLRVAPKAIPDVYTQIGEFNGSYETILTLPPDSMSISTVEINLSRSMAGSLFDGLEYLTGYPYGCVEQTMSRALPNAVVGPSPAWGWRTRS